EFNGKLSYVGNAPGYHVKIEPKQYAYGVQTQRKFIDDNQWGVLRNTASDMTRALGRTKEKSRADIFNYAFSAAFTYMQSEEGLSLCNDSHTTKSGTSTASGFDNAGTSPLSKTSVAATWLSMRGFRDSISEGIDMDDNFALIVPDALGDTAEEIVGTVKGLHTAEGTVNVQEGRYNVERYMRLDDTSTTNWFMVNWTLMKKSLLWINHTENEYNNTVDFETFSLKHSIYARWGNGTKDWRWISGHSV
ncbi:MAG: hypothetical protein GWP06_12520, partial [Actinobacteria bacterium]|nr:hypothetical protein [Actinomycetota bacterium]